MFGDIERLLKRFVQAAAGVAVLQREVVGFLELAENFRFAEHHGIESARDFEQDAARFAVRSSA